jgi:hypothetical protein
VLAHPTSKYVPTAAVLLGHLTSNLGLLRTCPDQRGLVKCLSLILRRAVTKSMNKDECDKCVAGSTMALLHFSSLDNPLAAKFLTEEDGLVELLIDVMISLFNPVSQVELHVQDEEDDSNVYYAMGCLANLASFGYITVEHVSHEHFFETLELEILKVVDVTEHAAILLLLNLCDRGGEMNHAILKSGILSKAKHFFKDDTDHPLLWMCFAHVVSLTDNEEDVQCCVNEGLIKLLVEDFKNPDHNHVCYCLDAIERLFVECSKRSVNAVQIVIDAIRDADSDIGGATLNNLRSFADVNEREFATTIDSFCKFMGFKL